jgi:hypothetical protein
VYIGEHRAFVWSGEVRDSHRGGMINTDDTWIFHTDTGTWRQVPTTVQPAPACHQAAAYSPDHELVLYAGGWRNDDQGSFQYSTTWVYHTEEERWEERHPGGDPFPVSSDADVVYHPGERKFVMLMAGPGEVFLYDPEADTWEKRPAPKAFDLAGARSDYRPGGSPIAGFDPVSGLIVVFGGVLRSPEGEKLYHDRTALYDLAANQFIALEPERHPGPRVRSAFAYDSRRERFVLFGGVQDQSSERMRDLWSFDPERREWREHRAGNTPSARGGYYDMAYDPELDRFFVLCGRHSLKVFLNDAWSLELDESAVGVARYVFDREQLGGCTSWFAEWRAPGDSRVELRFRGSADLLAWEGWSASPEEVLARDGRWLQVEVQLHPGSQGETPELGVMGFLRDAGEVETEPGEDVERMLTSVRGLR